MLCSPNVYVFTGTDYGYVKGMGFGWFAWYILENFVIPLVQLDLDLPHSSAAWP
ncbi:MAG: hypothetical protein AB1445_11420 [Bacillota bacterium]